QVFPPEGACAFRPAPPKRTKGRGGRATAVSRLVRTRRSPLRGVEELLVGELDAHLADAVRVLCDERGDRAGLERLHLRGPRVELHELYLARLAGGVDGSGDAVAGDDVHREDALEVRVGAQERRHQVCRLRLVVVAVLRPEVLDVRVLL